MKLTWKKLCAAALSAVLCVGMLPHGFVKEETVSAEEQTTPAVTEIPGTVKTEKEIDGSFLSVTGFAKGKVNDRSQYKEGDPEYAVVTNEEEFLYALSDAKSGDVKVIELRADMYLGWNELSAEAKASGMVEAYTDSLNTAGAPISNPSMIESGVSTVTLNDVDGLTIFSKTGHTLRHAEVKFNSGVNDLVIRNLRFTDTWDWDDRRTSGYGETGLLGTSKRTGWTNIKINGANNVWIDHCTFGVSFDGNIDIENGSAGISITWCDFGDVDYSVGSMLYKTIAYMETLYQQNKVNSEIGSFIIYSVMRDNGMSLEDISKYMGYHKKAHLSGAGDKDTWLYRENGQILANKDKTDANELIRLTFAYNNWTNIGSRVPMVRGGVAHLFNCFTDDTKMCEAGDIINSDPLKTGKTINQQVGEKGGAIHLLTRGMDARNGASIAADTNVYCNVSGPMIGDEKNEFSDEKFKDLFGYNHALIVNSKVKRPGSADYTTGSSWDNNGVNEFTKEYGWVDKSTIGNWSWGQEGEQLSYEYQTFSLDSVEQNVKTYGGAYTMDMTAAEWLQTDYTADTPLKVVDKTKEVPIETITLSKTEATLYMEEEFLQLDAKVTPSNTTELAASYTWTSSNPEVATVNECGLVLPKSTGETTITVKTKSGLEASCEVKVRHLPKSVSITNIPSVLYVGDEFTLTAEISPEAISGNAVTWANEGVRAELVDAEKGIFRAVKAGTNPVSVTVNMKGNRVGSEGVYKKVTLKFVERPEEPSPSPSPSTEPSPEPSVSPEPSESAQPSQTPQPSTEPGESPKPSETPDVMKGDVTGDKKVALDDAQLVLKFALKIETPTQEQTLAADVDENQVVDLKDAQLVLKYALKIINKF